MNLQIVDELFESSQYRSKHMLMQTTSRTVLDHAFMDLISLWILYNEFSTASIAQQYAKKTIQFGGFTAIRHTAPDLYLTLFIAINRAMHLTTATRNDGLLLDRARVNEGEVRRFLQSLGQNNANKAFVTSFLQRMERSLVISDSNYKSIRRLAQDWPSLSQTQRSLVMTRLMQFYRAHAPRSEMFYFIRSLASAKNLEITDATDAEQPKNKTTHKIAKATALGAIGVAAGRAGYAAGKRMA